MSVDNSIPLAEKLRPQTAQKLLGQEHIWSENSLLRKLAESSKLNAVILWGPPGTGKTSLARIIAELMHHPVEYLSAVEHGVKDIRSVIQRSEIRKRHQEASILIFMDEIHRLNKAQQDVLLPAIEAGTVKFIGATTENPSFTVNAAILSRCLLFQLKRLSEASLQKIVENAILAENLKIGASFIEKICQASKGDARSALNLVEALSAYLDDKNTEINEDHFLQLCQAVGLKHDRNSDRHYDLLSALIKSIRSSQVDAAVYYLARLIAAGEDPMLIARRLVIAASEDIGNASPSGLILASSAMQAIAHTGYPEARIILSQLTCYLAASPKSNSSYLAIDKALAEVEKSGDLDTPILLKNAPSQLMKKLNYGEGYIYAHDDPVGAFHQEYLPESIKHMKFYQPVGQGAEKQLAERLEHLRNSRK